VGCVVASLLGASDVQQPAVPSYGDRPEVQAFIQTMVASHQFDAPNLSHLFGEVQYNAEAVALVAPAKVPVRKNWRVYRSRFVEPQRIRAGVAFWKENREVLEKAEKEFGVPAEILVGILGVETIYGRGMGRFPVLDVLTTLAFDYPDSPSKPGRSAMFLHELEEYLVWCRDTQQDPTTFTGSYTGAIGIPQFLPDSIRAYGVDYDGDGRIDLRGSAADAIGSVARYLKEHRWQTGRPVLWPVARSSKSLAAAEQMADGDPELKETIGGMLDAGIRPLGINSPLRLKRFRKAENDTKALLVDLPTPDRPTEYRIGLTNFYVITRYNHSFFYATAVVDLGQAVKQALKRK
jgi:membrane-bound lytic murein transglycosylase B